MARSFTVLIETSDIKKPPVRTLGGEGGIFNPGTAQDGHVPRNIRLALAAIDLMQPYVYLEVAHIPGRSGCLLKLLWAVWGAIDVEQAVLMW